MFTKHSIFCMKIPISVKKDAELSIFIGPVGGPASWGFLFGFTGLDPSY